MKVYIFLIPTGFKMVADLWVSYGRRARSMVLLVVLKIKVEVNMQEICETDLVKSHVYIILGVEETHVMYKKGQKGIIYFYLP